MEDMSIEKVWLTDTAVWIRTTDGREACEKFADYSRLRYATKEQREAYTLSSVGIHWPEIDEDCVLKASSMRRSLESYTGCSLSIRKLMAQSSQRESKCRRMTLWNT